MKMSKEHEFAIQQWAEALGWSVEETPSKICLTSPGTGDSVYAVIRLGEIASVHIGRLANTPLSEAGIAATILRLQAVQQAVAVLRGTI